MNWMTDAIVRFFAINMNTSAHICNNHEWTTSSIDKDIVALSIVKRLASLTTINVKNELELMAIKSYK